MTWCSVGKNSQSKLQAGVILSLRSVRGRCPAASYNKPIWSWKNCGFRYLVTPWFNIFLYLHWYIFMFVNFEKKNNKTLFVKLKLQWNVSTDVEHGVLLLLYFAKRIICQNNYRLCFPKQQCNWSDMPEPVTRVRLILICLLVVISAS